MHQKSANVAHEAQIISRLPGRNGSLQLGEIAYAWPVIGTGRPDAKECKVHFQVWTDSQDV
jgi:hypothetical protein